MYFIISAVACHLDSCLQMLLMLFWIKIVSLPSKLGKELTYHLYFFLSSCVISVLLWCSSVLRGLYCPWKLTVTFYYNVFFSHLITWYNPQRASCQWQLNSNNWEHHAVWSWLHFHGSVRVKATVCLERLWVKWHSPDTFPYLLYIWNFCFFGPLWNRTINGIFICSPLDSKFPIGRDIFFPPLVLVPKTVLGI